MSIANNLSGFETPDVSASLTRFVHGDGPEHRFLTTGAEVFSAGNSGRLVGVDFLHHALDDTTRLATLFAATTFTCALGLTSGHLSHWHLGHDGSLLFSGAVNPAARCRVALAPACCRSRFHTNFGVGAPLLVVVRFLEWTCRASWTYWNLCHDGPPWVD